MPHRLPAREPAWATPARPADAVVIGSGVAGLTAALRARAHGLRVVLLTKDTLGEGSTRWAQGGIAAALDLADSPAQHLRDTLVAGAGLCDREAVEALAAEGPAAVRRLIAAGAEFDRDPDSGELLLTREGGHLRRRIIHAGGDATGAEVSRALLAALAADPDVEIIEHALALDLLTDASGRAAGVTLHVMGEGEHDGVGAVHARAVVLATGGLGQVFAATTNPDVSTGDGLALALRAGAHLADLEFVQFHPTVLYLGPEARGRQPLISEAVRGEGAHLVDRDGVRFMTDRHPLGELAPRDIVAKGIMSRMLETGADCAYLDARHFGAEMWEHRFPTILAACRAHGIDPVTDLIPVTPAAHHLSGGIRTDRRGRTTVPGLYACGEAACTGVHGANRLASNSLLEGLVFAERIADDVAERIAAGELPETAPAPFGPDPTMPSPLQPLLPDGARDTLQRAMSAGAGVVRTERSLAEAAAILAGLAAEPSKRAEPSQETWENANLHLVARALVEAARVRRETRGCHWREDHPERDDAQGRRRLLLTLDEAGAIAVRPGPPLPPEPRYQA
ncbi:L-aspartate oxidase [Mangrovactinospora gilvigrisea]|uniref:L-aspartate oxidase n=1 Tax=Mangrovactinospora gilvigrisea TaxID=1428644 RepID=A0A1J7BF39_9ACTN|nr:L-aspartate oxidase [Mangrovactinospora gilvigrisea]OIV37319.1 L-aspartate oxidase [Mangrovactinospora gilvigrisea]